MKTCKTCNEVKPFTEFNKTHKGKYYNSYCKECSITKASKWGKNNPDKRKKSLVNFHKNNPNKSKEYNDKNGKPFRLQSGLGIYEVLLNDKCLYVGEGQLHQRMKKHIEYENSGTDVCNYVNANNIPREYLSFNVLEYNNNRSDRRKIEARYKRELKPIINPL